MTIYIDSLFFTNFFMDSVIFALSSALLRRSPPTLRILLGSLLSASYGAFMFFPQLSVFYTAAAKLAVSVLFVLVVFGAGGFARFLRAYAVFWFISTTAGGTVFAITVLAGCGKSLGAMVSNGVFYLNINPFMLGAGCLVLYILTGAYRRSCIKNTLRRELTVDLEVKYLGRLYRLTGLIDTGCTLEEPLSGEPVIVAESRAFAGIPAPQNNLTAFTAAGKCTLGLILPEAVVSMSDKFMIRTRTPIALTDKKLGGGQYNALINPLAAEEYRKTKCEGTICCDNKT